MSIKRYKDSQNNQMRMRTLFAPTPSIITVALKTACKMTALSLLMKE